MTRPTPADFTQAEAMFRDTWERDPEVSRQWIAMHRDNSIYKLAVAFMAQRQHAEWKQGFAVEARKERRAA